MSLAASAGRDPGTMWSPTHVQVTVLQARGLRAKGPGGTSDAYAVIQVGKEKYATSVSERCLGAPVWREEATFELPPLLSSGAGPAATATLQLTVLHRALLGLDKFLGRAEVDLRALHRDRGRRKTQWYTLKSKPGKKDKQRGEIEVDIQFMRNNMTASMFDLSMKDKSRNPFGKLKDKIKGKHKDSASDTASAIVPSGTPSVDSDDESFSKEKKKKSKIKTLFSKSNLQKTPLSQSMSVLPTAKPDKMLLRPGDFQSRWDDDDNEDESSSASDVMSHKRTASADLKQPSHINFTLPRKEGLSFLGGLRSKNDSLSRSNVCINGSHVYMEQPEAKSETKDSSPSNFPSPQGFRKKQLFSSTENLANLATGSSKDPEEGGGLSCDRQLSDPFNKDSVKSIDSLESTSLPLYRSPDGRDTREHMDPANLESVKETKDSKKQESKKSSLLSLVMGKKDVAKGSEGESPSPVPGKEKEDTIMEAQLPEEDLVRKPEKDTTALASRQGNSLNPFEDEQNSEPEAGVESKTELKPPVPTPRAPQTKAVKPRLEVSPEAQPKARPPSPLDSALLFSILPSSSAQTPVPFELKCDSETQSSESPSVFSFSSPMAPPISTSTPLEHWLPVGKGEANPEEPSLLLKADLQRESLVTAPNMGPCALGSLCEQLLIPVQEGTEESPPLGKAGETGQGKKASNEESGEHLLEEPDMGQQEGFLRIPSPEQDSDPSPEEAQEIPFALSFSTGRIASPAENSPVWGNTDFEGQSRSFVKSDVSEGEITSAIKEVTPPLQEGEAAPFDIMLQKHEEISLNAAGGQKKVKKHVSFSKQLLMEDGAEKPTGPGEEDESHSQQLTHKGAAAVNLSSVHTEGVGKEPLTLEDSVSKGPTSEAVSVRGTLLLKTEEDDALVAQCQSKASDHEGCLSDPLSGLPSASDVKSSSVADLNLSLPSIPEVASDDERIDEAGDFRKAAEPVTLEAGPLSWAVSSPCLEKAQDSSGRPHGSVPMESLHDFKLRAPKAPPSEQTTVLEIPKLHISKNSSVDRQLLDPDAGEEENLKGSEKPSTPFCMSLDCPVPSHSLSETFPAVHSFPSSPHSDTHNTSTAESQKKATTEGPAGKVENFGKRKPLLQAWVLPSETHPVTAQPSTGAGAAKHRLHPVKPMNTAPSRTTNPSLGTATIISENLINEATMKKYKASDPAFAYAQLTHDELIQLVLKQKETISKKEFQVRELEDYIDNLLVRVMEETPNILRVPAQVKRAGKM